ncbi:hypothetical protein [Antribacter gilvus]|uniref:hypothetical protein n=1 Tax=Antribacter gilvus TaxID=2304675 RepID=UPI000F7A1F21|nr:hypothetical protein [Antribacter gilvus]
MRVFRPKRSPKIYEVAIVPGDDPRAWEWYQAIRSAPERDRESVWTPVPLMVTHPISGRRALKALVPWSFSEVLVLRDEAIGSVGRLLATHGDLLPVAGVNASLLLFVAPMVSDEVLIEERSKTTRMHTWSEEVRIEFGTFWASELEGRSAFTVRVGRNLQLLFREDLVEELIATGHTSGVDFEPMGLVVDIADLGSSHGA